VTALEICETLCSYYQQEQTKKELVFSGKKGASSSTSGVLEELGMDLTQMARDGLLDPVQGRQVEIQRCLRTLLRRRKNNVCLIGDAGVGKTAIVEGIAQVLVDPQQCPRQLQNYRILSLEMANLIANTKYRGEFEERLQNILQECTNPQAPPTILFIDEIHTVMGTGSVSNDGSIDAANILKPALARGALQLIGATTMTEYRQHIEKDVAFARRLQPVLVSEPSVVQCIDILLRLQSYYEQYHQVCYTDGAIRAAVELSERYITDRFLPDKALDLLDEAGALMQFESTSDGDDDEKPVVSELTMRSLVSEWSGIPLGKMESLERARLVSLEQQLSQRVKGQSRPIRRVSQAIRRARSGLQDPQRPIASFLFCGPTGTGKTELCKTLAATYYGSERDMIRLDMSEYQERYTVSRLTGPPPGYIGYEAGGQLTEAVRRSPHSLVLLDEIEKAHEDVLNILLQILEDGILTDGKGRTVNFKNTILVMTSNVGSRRILDLCRPDQGSGLNVIRASISQTLSDPSNDSKDDSTDHPLYPQLLEVVQEELEGTMKPELLNRIDEIVVFSPLSHPNLVAIAELQTQKIAQRLSDEHQIRLHIMSNLIDQIVREGSANSDQYGARPMRRAAQRFVEDCISDAFLQGFLVSGDNATLSLRNESVEISKSSTDEVWTVTVDSPAGIGSFQSINPNGANAPGTEVSSP
jgi:ATP-dependent Clp protease ATP-binding subunit ClpC